MSLPPRWRHDDTPAPRIPPDELEYLRGVYKRFDLPADADILVVGPGTGVDAWIASLRTRRPIRAIGINPLEAANTRAAARIAGFQVRALVGDNAADAEGRSLLWNHAPLIEGRNMVAAALESAGTGGKVFDLKVERFLKRSRQPQEWYRGCLYTVAPLRPSSPSQ